MPDTPYDIPLDLELLRVGLHMDETHAVARYTLSGRDGDFFCLVRDAENASSANLVPAIEETLYLIYNHCDDPNLYYDEFEDVLGVVWTNGLAENDPETYAANEWTPLNEDYSLAGHITSVEKISAAELNARSHLTEQRRRNIQMAFDNLEQDMCLDMAQTFAARDIDSWSAYEICSARSEDLPEDLLTPLCESLRDHRQVRELHRLAQCVHDRDPEGSERLHDLYAKVAEQREFTPEKLRLVRRVLVAADYDFDPSWLRLDHAQLGETWFALRSGVPSAVVRLYTSDRFSEFPASAMDCLTFAYIDGLRGEDFSRLLNPAYNTRQLWEVEAACAAHTHLKDALTTEQLDLICNPALPQPVMNALRLGFTHYGLSVDAARGLITPDVTSEQVWDLIEAKDAPGEVAETEPVTTEDAHKQPQHSTLRDTERRQRKASDKLSTDEGHGALEPTCEEKE